MLRRISKALLGTIAVAGLLAGTAGAAVKVTVRIEGAHRTLVPAERVTVPANGSITKYGAPAGACSRASAAGVLDEVTHGRWVGKWFSFGDYLVDTILGETHRSDSTHPLFWSLDVNYVSSSSGICGTKLARNASVLFFVDDFKKPLVPLALRNVPRSVRAGSTFHVLVVRFDAKGKAHRAAGITVRGGSTPAKSDSRGVATVTAARSGRLVLRADGRGFVRSESESVRVSA